MNRLDLYPSRTGQRYGLIPRQDPVVRTDSAEDDKYGAKLQQFEEDGFMVLEDLFDQDEVKSMQSELDLMLNRHRTSDAEWVIKEPGSDDVRSIFKVHEINDFFKHISEDRRIVSLAEKILNDKVYIHQSRANYKPGFRGKEFYWHSDFETWHVEDGMPNMRAVSVSIILSDNYEYNGPLMLIPGSHKCYVSCGGVTPENNYRESLRKQTVGTPADEDLAKLFEERGVYTFTGKAGSVLFFDCNTMHGSNGNISPRPRSNLFFVYNACINRLEKPYGNISPRPEYLARRHDIKPIQSH